MDKNKSWVRATQEAQSVVKDPAAVEMLADKAKSKSRKLDDRLKEIKKDLDSLIRLSRAWASGKYKDVGWASILIVVGAITYFVNPFDAVPDFLPLIGLSDDLSVIAFAVSRVKRELDRFHEWESEVTIK